MEIFKNDSGVSLTVDELFKIYEHDFFDELIALIVSLDATKVNQVGESKIRELLEKVKQAEESS